MRFARLAVKGREMGVPRFPIRVLTTKGSLSAGKRQYCSSCFLHLDCIA